jgi:UDP-N-acetylglucosamine 2-epimerase
MDDIEISYVLEEEKKKCIEKMKEFNNKYGDKNLQKLADYLQSHLDDSTEEIKKEIEEDLKIINSYL